MIRYFLASLAVAVPLSLWAEQADEDVAIIVAEMPADTLAVIEDAVVEPACSRRESFHPNQLIFPTAALALGGAGVNNHFVNSHGTRRHYSFDDELQYAPYVLYAGLGFIPGVKHNHNFGDRVLAGATAFVVMAGVTEGLKHAVRETRPDGTERNAFPSGHAAKAFCGAELTRIEYGNGYGAAAYAFAVTTGVMRVVNDRHWCNDVLAGAGIGFLSAHVGYWLLPYEKRLCQRVFHRKDRKSLSNSDSASACGGERSNDFAPFILAPSYDYETKAPMLSFSMCF